ncbi:MAG: zinc dependent phospholipase C family protein [Acidobacteriota bacterium]|nr:zinc dependent phospholipase C family protein [Acidobacteriota bacterium]
MMISFRTIVFSLLIALFVLPTQQAGGYSFLTHEEIIDLTWTDSIQPLLLSRYPNLTAAQLEDAHAYAYGGCLIQDLGYYPFGKPNFSDLLHYVRTGDFVRALFRESKNANDIAFSIGALSHYLGDTIGHPEAIDLAVGKSFPELAAIYGPNVNYAEGKRQHVRAEFAFDINNIAKHRMAPEKFLNHIGFAVSVPLLTRAFYDTYGLDLAKVIRQDPPNLRGYRYAVRSLLPRVAYAETILHRHRLPPDVTSPALDEFNQEIATLAGENHWDTYHLHAGVGTYLLAGLIFILPKVGPLADLSLKGPTPSAEQDYVNSLMHTATVFRQTLAAATTNGALPNKDLDTGDLVYPGTYSLEDYTYAQLLHSMTSDPATPIPFGIKQDLLAYFADPEKAKYLKRKPKMLAQVMADLPILQTISTRAAYPDSAFLPEPTNDMAPNQTASPEATAAAGTQSKTTATRPSPASTAPTTLPTVKSPSKPQP